MHGKVECGTLDLTSIKSLPEIQISHFIACKNYDEKITTIHTCRIYYDVISKGKESKQQQIQKNKRLKRIFLVDDEYDVNLVMKLVLEENGFKVDSFTDSSEALENFKTGVYDLVILDVKMPAMDGLILHFSSFFHGWTFPPNSGIGWKNKSTGQCNAIVNESTFFYVTQYN